LLNAKKPKKKLLEIEAEKNDGTSCQWQRQNVTDSCQARNVACSALVETTSTIHHLPSTTIYPPSTVMLFSISMLIGNFLYRNAEYSVQRERERERELVGERESKELERESCMKSRQLIEIEIEIEIKMWNEIEMQCTLLVSEAS